MNAMVEMSRAIRHTIEDHAPTLKQLRDQELDDFVLVVGAFYLDMREEQERRRSLDDGTGFNVREGSAMIADRIEDPQ